jgi:hypothetical protein
MKDPFQNIEIDRDNLVLGLLNTVLEHGLFDPDSWEDSIKAALKRLYPGAHNVGSIDCLTCLDMGVVCSQCEHLPHKAGCQNIKGLPTLAACSANCEASLCAADKLKDEKIMDLNDRVRELERQLQATKEERSKL